jgi:alpha-L-fucosidase 2
VKNKKYELMNKHENPFRKLFCLSIILLMSLAKAVCGQSPTPVQDTINWQHFLGRSDMKWLKMLPNSWDNGVFLGNGTLGTIFWVNKGGAFNFEISRGDLYDHRGDLKNRAVLYNTNRLPNGHFELALDKTIATGTMRLDLWNAEAKGSIGQGDHTDSIRCFTAADRNVIILEITGHDRQQLKWLPDTAKSTRPNPPKNYKPYPVQSLQQEGDIQVSVQDMPEDDLYGTGGKGEGQYATAWCMEIGEHKTIYYISMGFSYPGTTAAKEAVDLIRKAKKDGIAKIDNRHRAWWHSYYPKSFVSIPDGQMESFYWIQLYKMASASRGGGPILDLMGPWFRTTVWPAIWWNLNIQLAYWPYYMSNHLEEAEPLARTIWADRANLAFNAKPFEKDSYAIGRATPPDGGAPVGGEVGNLPWVMHNLWMYYRSTMDDQYLKKELFPLMKGSFNYLSHIAVKQPDGKWALPKTASPEYTDGVENSTYTLACLRWLAQTLIIANERLKAGDPIIKRCKDLLENLVPYETDEVTGFMVGKNMPFIKSHRHWSHLFMIYPFHEYNWDNPDQVPLIRKSLDNWVSMPQAFAGYSWLGAASILEAGNRGDEALTFLQTFLRRAPLPNTLYREGSPVVETPLAFARTVQEMLMTSHGDMIRIFPGVPSLWRNVSYANLRAEGAFLISANRRNGITEYIRIKSLAGELCRVNTGFLKPIQVLGVNPDKLKELGHGIVEISLQKGQEVILYTGNKIPNVIFSPVDFSEDVKSWGERKPF